MDNEISELVSRFNFVKPVEIDPTIEPGDDQRLEILDNKIVIGIADGTMPDEIIELVARAKISENDPS
jgi:hypothetical protein